LPFFFLFEFLPALFILSLRLRMLRALGSAGSIAADNLNERSPVQEASMSDVYPPGYPRIHEGWLTLKDGQNIFLRPVLPTDGSLLVDLFNQLSPQTIYLRFLSNLSALPEEWVYRFTHVDYKKDFALLGLVKEGEEDEVIAVGRYAYDVRTGMTDLAVAVRDDWQHRGLGKALLSKVVEIGRANGISRFESMIAPHNETIKSMLVNLGFKVTYSLQSGFFRVDIHV
jgi:GNAT superfamily N-acetyltransferase